MLGMRGLARLAAEGGSVVNDLLLTLVVAFRLFTDEVLFHSVLLPFLFFLTL